MPKKKVETLYGPIEVDRWVYQSSKGGRLYVPMDDGARLLQNGTPRFIKVLGWKYGQMSGEGVEEDLAANHGRQVSSHYIQKAFSALGDVMRECEMEWTYNLPNYKLDEVHSISLGRDGTTTHIRGEGYKESMAGTITLYGKESNRLTTIYLGCAPEKGKETFDLLFLREIQIVKNRYPNIPYIGLADGAPDNWTVLHPQTDVQILDFFHAAEYVKKYCDARGNNRKRQKTFEELRHTLRHDEGGASTILEMMNTSLGQVKKQSQKEKIQTSVTYFENHLHQMDYCAYSKLGYSIGSGVTEAACKTLVKERLSKSGMRWTRGGVDDILMARGLILSNRWDIFWGKVDRQNYYRA